MDSTYSTRSRRNGAAIGIAMAIILSGATGISAQSLDRAPYLQQVTSTSAMVIWRTSSAAPCSLTYGVQGGPTQTVVTAQDTDHMVSITGLSAATDYPYSIRCNGQLLASGEDFFIRTAPQPGSGGKVRVLAWGDSGKGNSEQFAVAAALNAEDAEMGIHVGDIVYPGGEPGNWDPRYFEPYAPLLSRVPVHGAPGNHDMRNPEGYIDAYFNPTNPVDGSELFYSYDYGDIHFVVINTDDALTSSILDWLNSDLASTERFWKFVYFHHPLHSCSDIHGSDSGLINLLAPIFEAQEVDLVAYGHDHHYERVYPMIDETPVNTHMEPDYVDPGAPIYILTGGGADVRSVDSDCSHSAYAESISHFTRFTFEGDTVIVEAVDINRDVFDSMTLRKTGGSPTPFARVLSPDGGESLAIDETTNLTWETSAGITDVVIELSRTSATGPWETLFGSTPNDGSEDWNVTGAASSTCWLRVRDVSSGAEDISDAPFTIFQPFVQLDSPTGGETWTIAETAVITWSTSPGVGDLDIELSRSGPSGPWETLFTATTNDGSKTWTVNGPPSSQCYLRLSENAGSLESTSAAAFEIVYPPASIQLTAPNGGESFLVGDGIDITWTSSLGIDSVRVELSRDGTSGPWETLWPATPSDGTETWTATGPSTQSAFLRISTLDQAAADTSDAAFDIEQPFVMLTSPTGGEGFTVGDNMQVTWNTSPSIGNLDIELSRNGPSGPWETLFSDTPNDGEQSWNVSGPPASQCYVRLKETSGSLESTNATAFSIAYPPASIQLTAPNGGESFLVGDGIDITWTASLGIDSVRVELSRDGASGPWETLWPATPSDGTETWAATGPGTQSALLRISTLDQAAADTSDAAFDIEQPFVQLTSPTGGENLTIDDDLLIAWQSSASVGSVDIELSRSGSSGPWETLFLETDNDGSESWTVSGPPSQDVWFRITDPNLGVQDQTSSSASIRAPPGITLLSPNGTESYFEAGEIDIQWSASDDITDVRVELSRNGLAGPWSILIESTANDGQETWNATGPASADCWLRVSDIDDNYEDFSDAAFSIESSFLTLTAPSGGENLTIGTDFEIQWTSSANIGNVDVELSRSGSTGPWETLFAQSSNDGQQTWSVTGPQSTQAWIRVKESAGGLSSQNTAAFSIVEPPAEILVLAPNGGESLTTGSDFEIQWTSSGVDGEVRIELSRSGVQGPWEFLFESTANDGQETWTVTEPVGSSCWIRISNIDDDIADMTDSTFEILQPTPSAAVFARINFQPQGAPVPSSFTPDYGEAFDAARGFGWDQDRTFLMEERLILDDDPRDTLLDRINNKSISIWELDVPNGDYEVSLVCGDPLTSATHRIEIEGIRVVDDVYTSGETYIAVSGHLATVADGRLSIAAGGIGDLTHTKLCWAEVKSPGQVPFAWFVPSGGEVACLGETLPLSWSPGNGTGDVSIELSRAGPSGPWETLFASTANDGAEDWVVTGSASQQCYMRLTHLDDNQTALSLVPFQITESAFTLNAPLSTDAWTVGETQLFDWNSSCIDSIRIEASSSGTSGPWNPLLVAPAADRSAAYTVQPQDSTWTHLRVLDPETQATLSTSLAPSVSPPAQDVVILTPNGGEALYVGDMHEIRWQSTSVDAVNVEIRLQDGTWEMIATNLAATQTPLEWQVPDDVGSSHLIRISSTEGYPADSSDSPFTILDGPPINTWIISFEAPDAIPPDGHIADEGLIFDAARGYGWDQLMSMKERGMLSNDCRDAFVQVTNTETGVWNVAVPSGTYTVNVTCGDPWTSGTHRVEVEGQMLISDVYATGGEYVEASIDIEITDGFLTMIAGGSGQITSTKVNCIEIYPVATDVENPPVTEGRPQRMNLRLGQTINRDATQVFLDLPEPATVWLDLFDVRGRRLRNIYSGRLAGGSHQLVWRPFAQANAPLASGVYFLRLYDGSMAVGRKVLLIRP